MSFQQLILSAVLLTSTLAQNASLSSSTFLNPSQLTATRAFAPEAARDKSGFDSAYHLLLTKPVQDKNFYLLSLLQRDPKVRRLLIKDRVLKELTKAKVESLEKAANCEDVNCFIELLRFDGPTIEAVATELQTLANHPELKLLAKNDLRPSGVFIKYSQQSEAQMLVAAWKDASEGMNRILNVYGLGEDPHYRDIDRVSYNVKTEAYRSLLKAKIAEIKLSKEPVFFEPTLSFALALLEINRRDEAGRYEPLEQGVNKTAVQNLKNIRWRDYPYSFILVLGSGPSNSTRLSAIGAKRADVGAQLFLQHQAPLIIFSGGHVHPMQTPYSEAIEMKRYVMEKYQVPETSILVDPQARHTTTNFRNAARLAIRYQIPAALTALVTSSEDHITYTVGPEFRKRCQTELGYFPVEFIKQVSPDTAAFKPSVASLFFDASDPLDP